MVTNQPDWEIQGFPPRSPEQLDLFGVVVVVGRVHHCLEGSVFHLHNLGILEKQLEPTEAVGGCRSVILLQHQVVDRFLDSSGTRCITPGRTRSKTQSLRIHSFALKRPIRIYVSGEPDLPDAESFLDFFENQKNSGNGVNMVVGIDVAGHNTQGGQFFDLVTIFLKDAISQGRVDANLSDAVAVEFPVFVQRRILQRYQVQALQCESCLY